MPSGENATARTVPVWPTSVQRSRPVVGSHSLMVPSSLAEASVFPSGEKATAQTIPACPLSVWRSEGLAASATSQTFTVPSQLPEARVRPSGENATESTIARVSPEPVVEIGELSAGGHVPEPDGPIRRPPRPGSGRRARRPGSGFRGVGASSGRRSSRVATSHSKMVPSSGAVARIAPSGEKATGHEDGPVGGRRLRSRPVSRSQRLAAVVGQGPAVDGEAEDRCLATDAEDRVFFVRGLERRSFPTGGHVPPLDRVVGPPDARVLPSGVKASD